MSRTASIGVSSRSTLARRRNAVLARAVAESLESRRLLAENPYYLPISDSGTYEGDYVGLDVDFANHPGWPWSMPTQITFAGVVYEEGIDYDWSDSTISPGPFLVQDNGDDLTISYNNGVEDDYWIYDPDVQNVAPTATFKRTSQGPILIGQTVSYAFSNQFDPSGPDTTYGFVYSYDFNNNGSFGDTGEANEISNTSRGFAYTSPGTKVIHGRVTDKDGGYRDYYTTVTVSNISADLSNDGPVSTNSPVTVRFANTFGADTLNYSVDWGNDGTFEIYEVSSPVHSTTFGSSGAKTVRGRIEDGYGNTVTYTTTVSVVNTAPATPTQMAAIVVSDDRIDLTWEHKSTADGYYIDYSPASNFAGALTIDTSARVNKTSVTDLNPNTPYYFRIRSYNSVGSSGNSSTEIEATHKLLALREQRSTTLVKDLKTAPSSAPSNFIAFNNMLFFTANNGTSGIELWKSNGTSTGTSLVMDINSGAGSSSPSHLTVVGGVLYFSATNGTNGVELWRSNGGSTSTDTYMVKDINTGGDSSPENLTAMGTTLFFSATNGSDGVELWKSNGTSTGTSMVRNINTSGSSSPSSLAEVTISGLPYVFFSATNGTDGRELWKSNGDSGGTVMVKDIYTGGANSSDPMHITAMGEAVYFSAERSTDGRELWRSDGTSSGTLLLKNIMPDDVGDGVQGSNPKDLHVLGSRLYFTAENNYSSDTTKAHNRELWVTNGQSSGTYMFYDFFKADEDGRSSLPTEVDVVGDVLLLTALEEESRDAYFTFGAEVSPTVSGPGKVGKLDAPLPGAFFGANPTNYVHAGGAYYFMADDLQHGYELYKIQEGFNSLSMIPLYMPRMLRDIGPGAIGGLGSDVEEARSRAIAAVGGVVFFAADDGEHGLELWRTNGTSSGTILVKDINTGNSGSSANEMLDLNGTLYFAADGHDASGNSVGTELWRSDGTSEGTSLLMDINGSGSSSPSNLIRFNDTQFLFAAADATSGTELWISDGTPENTERLKDIYSGSGSSNPSGFTRLGSTSTFLFTATNGSDGYELWKTDGTPSGTQMVENINSGGSSNPSHLFPITFSGTDYVLFAADDSTNSVELWISNGDAAGTDILKNINTSGGGSSVPKNFAAMSVGGTLYAYFTATTPSEGAELWRTDGTTGGTTRVVDIRAGSPGADPDHIVVMPVGGVPHLLFTANNGTDGIELWKSNGTSSGTAIVRDIYSGSSGGWPVGLTVVGTSVFFSATNGTDGIELWSSDGSSAGTAMVKNIASGSGSSSPANFIDVDGRLYFTATDSAGTELWVSDGTTAGTTMVSDINSGGSSSSPSGLTIVGDDKLYFAADNGSHGQELWLASAFRLAETTNSSTVSGSGANDRIVQGFKVAGYRALGDAENAANRTFNSFTTSGSSYIWENTNDDVRLIVTITTDIDDTSARGINAVLDNYSSTGLVVTDVIFDLPQIIAYSSADYRMLSAKAGGIEFVWPSVGSLNQESGWWMYDGAPGAYSPIASFYNSEDGEGVGIVAFNTAMDPTQVYWTGSADGITPHVRIKPLAGVGKSGTYTITQFVGNDMPTTTSSYYRETFLAPLMDDLDIQETTYQITPGIWGYANAQGTVPGPGSGGHWSEVVTDDLYDPDYHVNSQPNQSMIEFGVEGVWVWPATDIGKAIHEPYRIDFGWVEDFADVISALGNNNLGVVINPYGSYDYDANGVIEGDVIYRSLSDPDVRQALGEQRDHLDEHGVTAAFWDTGMTPQRSRGTVEDWLNVLSSWAAVGIHIAPENGNDVSSWITGANMHYAGGIDNRGDKHYPSPVYHLWYGGTLDVSNVVTPNSTQFIESTGNEAGLQGETDDGRKFWWEVGVESGMVAAPHDGQLRHGLTPRVIDVGFNAAPSPDTLTVQFSHDVSVSLDNTVIQLINLLTGQSQAVSYSSMTGYNSGTNTATFEIASGSLSSGIYRMTVLGHEINQGSNSYMLNYWGDETYFDFEVL